MPIIAHDATWVSNIAACFGPRRPKAANHGIVLSPRSIKLQSTRPPQTTSFTCVGTLKNLKWGIRYKLKSRDKRSVTSQKLKFVKLWDWLKYRREAYGDFLVGRGVGLLKISANVTEGIRGRGHQKRFDSIWDVLVPLRGWGEGGGKGRTTAPFALEALTYTIMATRQEKTPKFPIFLKKKKTKQNRKLHWPRDGSDNKNNRQ